MTAASPTPAAVALLTALIEGIDAALPRATELRREIHRHPDLGGSEGPTTARLSDALGLAATPLADTGFHVRLGPGGPSVAIRAELDALPVTEATDVDWASRNAAMHACGHDVHMAGVFAVLEAAKSLDLPVGMVGLFQPREECQPSGAPDVLDSGVLASEEIGAVIGAHVQPRVARGVISTGVGGVNAAADAFDIVVRGHGGHGAYPHVTVDPMPILAAITLGLHELVGRSINPVRPALITVGKIDAGTVHNVIPEFGSLHGIIRTMHAEDRAHLHADIRRLAEHTAAARGATAEVHLLRGDPVLSNDRELVHATDGLLTALGLTVAEDPFRSLGADDFSHYGLRVPIVMIFVGTGEESGTRHDVGLHHPRYLPADDSVRQVAIALAAGWVAGAELAGAI